MIQLPPMIHSSLHDALADAGVRVWVRDGQIVFSGGTETAVQAVIDSHDPLPYARADALTRVKTASAEKRLQYVTQSAGKDAEYTFKAAEAAQFVADGSVGVFMAARVAATGETAAAVAAEWNARSTAWRAIGAQIAAIEDKAGQDLAACVDWTLCDGIASVAIASIEAIA